jgi:hypothetical protein
MRSSDGKKTTTTVAEVVSHEVLVSLARMAGHQGLDPLFISREVRDSLRRVGVRIRRALPESAVSRVWKANLAAVGRPKARGHGLIEYAILLLLGACVLGIALALIGAQLGQLLADGLGLLR